MSLAIGVWPAVSRYWVHEVGPRIVAFGVLLSEIRTSTHEIGFRLSDNRDRSVRDDPLGDQVSYSDQDTARYGIFLSVDLLLDDVPSYLRSSGPFDNLLGQVVC